MTLDRSQRLSASEVRQVVLKGKKRYGQGLIVHKIDGTPNKGCVIVGIKISKKAVIRNRLRRQFKAVLQQIFKQQTIGSVAIRLTSIEAKPSDMQTVI